MRNETQRKDWHSWVSFLNPTYNFKADSPVGCKERRDLGDLGDLGDEGDEAISLPPLPPLPPLPHLSSPHTPHPTPHTLTDC
ncbi:MAG: hypothetical protein F6J93_21590 [Oscillatoria sp. SIO1A7]|nr:hypothetical protein [Oscillatoria sp. SIO1A7]